MSLFVLVPGGWSGGWQWRRVANRLRGAGHKVFTPTLTGLGERVHLASPEVGLDAYVRDIVNNARSHELDDPKSALRARKDGWQYLELDRAHVPMETAPRELGDTLLTIGETV